MAKELQFKFKIQPFQTHAVYSICDVFKGQPFLDAFSYMMDTGVSTTSVGKSMKIAFDEEIQTAFKNNEIKLTDEQLLLNIKEIQKNNGIKESSALVNELGRVELDIEMETGTGKTYVYIKTMFELNKQYGFSKFIVVVPSIAIREGVYKSFEYTQEHFMEYYHKKVRYFIYNSSKLNDLESFSSDNSIQVMIINAQAFNSRGEEARRIYEKLDSFQSRKPIDVIAANNPIVILDEPQKLGGTATQESLRKFNPLFTINYSATHKKEHNLVYVLDALDAYNKKLVKKIAVKGIEVKNLKGTDRYLYLEDILISKSEPPKAKIEFEVGYKGYIKREVRILGVKDDLYYLSNRLEEYRNGFIIKDINPLRSTVTFTNGIEISCGTASGDVNETTIRRIQIRETILSHLEKEKVLFPKGIKTLSLFFIDEVAKYRAYDDSGREINGDYGTIFEEEYNRIVSDYILVIDDPYSNYLKGIETNKTHNGYFSIDKKSNRLVNPTTKKRGEEQGISDDVSAYDLILKDKKRLLSFEEPTRFIFSHSALREGWDNPNVFQICTLKHSDSTIQKHQEVGRGLRLCVNYMGDRIDATVPGIDVHKINKLTVVASESYKDFVKGLQESISKDLYERPTKAEVAYFVGKTVKTDSGNVLIDNTIATKINFFLIQNGYVDEDARLTQKYYDDVARETIAKLPPTISHLQPAVEKMLSAIYTQTSLDDMIVDDKQSVLKENPVNGNINKKEFKELWRKISTKSMYTVNFESSELISNSIKYLNENLRVSDLIYTVQSGEQDSDVTADTIRKGESFTNQSSRTDKITTSINATIKYDLIGKLSEHTNLTRRSIVEILKGLTPPVFGCFRRNPEEFITLASRLINEQKASIIVEQISYNLLDEHYDVSIFSEDKKSSSFANAFKANNHICDYVFTDGTAEKSVERRFVESLDKAEEVVVYAKLPKGFDIPTPVGSYSPDWAIAFKEGTVKHIYFVAETKGSLSSLDLREIEKSKIECCRKLFKQCLSREDVHYDVVDNYDTLMKIVKS